jgi:hypothetical protein
MTRSKNVWRSPSGDALERAQAAEGQRGEHSDDDQRSAIKSHRRWQADPYKSFPGRSLVRPSRRPIGSPISRRGWADLIYTSLAARAALTTSPACPVTLTFRHTFSTLPFDPIKNVQRSIPMYFRPYIDFSTQAP